MELFKRVARRRWLKNSKPAAPQFCPYGGKQKSCGLRANWWKKKFCQRKTPEEGKRNRMMKQWKKQSKRFAGKRDAKCGAHQRSLAFCFQHYKVVRNISFWHTSSLKLALTNDQQITQLELCLWDHENNGECYSDMLDCVHVDEKWFFMQSDRNWFLLASDEELPYNTTHHKGYICKVMFLSAITHPQKIRGQW